MHKKSLFFEQSIESDWLLKLIDKMVKTFTRLRKKYKDGFNINVIYDFSNEIKYENTSLLKMKNLSIETPIYVFQN